MSSTSERNSNRIESDELRTSLANNVVNYDPIRIRQNRKPAPTIATGRRPKHFVLEGEEAIRREQRREKNRETARKLKEKRQLIEEKLDQKLKELKGENSDLETRIQQLQQKKRVLEEEINSFPADPLHSLLSNTNTDANSLLFFEQLSDDSDFFDDTIDKILFSSTDVCQHSI
ncbi:unnamed protein product [Adineta ricciae]|uniref:BZIP domain-containing protein n=1 Tax=Adineta ricciae TaxID=249248 RepID=A0A814SKS2_ADIRI|nr:unnamed protein product [Adineta ricciae]CAF1149417.1 unnamed protein product [Adineta ricciae]